MPVMDVDITALVAIWMGGLILLVPLAGLTARFALEPVLDAVARVRRAGAGVSADEFELRFARFERQLDTIAETLARQQNTEDATSRRSTAFR